MYYIYHNGCIISSPYKTIRFTKVDVPNTCVRVYDPNLRIYEIQYSVGATYDQIPDVTIIGETQEIDLIGDIKLFYSHTVNNLKFYIRYNNEYPGHLFSCFIDNESSQLSYNENNVGGYLIYPEVDVTLDKTSEIIQLINTNSELFYVVVEDGLSFHVSNIQFVDMEEKEVLDKFDDLIPFGKYPKLYLTEADIIAGFINKCKTMFPEIEFFPQSSERKNLGKETIYFKSQISQEKSIRFSSNIIDDAERGKVIQTTIPVEMYYQTSDIKQYVNRRDSYLMNSFMMDVHDFTVTKNKGYSDRFGNQTETFKFATYWDRSGVQNDLIKQDAPDTSGRDTYSLNMICDLIAFIIEKSQYVLTINQIIMGIYVGDPTSATNIKTYFIDQNVNP